MSQVSIEITGAPQVSVEIVNANGVMVVEVDRPSVPDVVEVIHPGPQGPSAARSRRHEWANPYSYCGTAPLGAADAATAWTVTRLQINAAGAVVATGMATAIAWTARASAVYS